MADNQTVLNRAADILDYDEATAPLTLSEVIEAAVRLLYDECPWEGVYPTAISARMELACRLGPTVILSDLNAWAEANPESVVIAALRGVAPPSVLEPFLDSKDEETLVREADARIAGMSEEGVA